MVEQWVHIIRRHPELASLIEELLKTIQCPEAITPDPITGRWRYWRSEIGPTRWVKVIVAWDEGPPWIVTAFPTGRMDQ
jgi:hypothetical protein